MRFLRQLSAEELRQIDDARRYEEIISRERVPMRILLRKFIARFIAR
jgi:hypothetical protein